MKSLLPLLFRGMLCCFITAAAGDFDALAAGDGMSVLTSTFPMYQITRNVTSGRKGVTVALMIPAQLGCPHDYVLTPRDMQKLATADVLVINGLGMEEFLGAPVEKANSELKIIDSSAGIKEILPYADRREPDPSVPEAPPAETPDSEHHHGHEPAAGMNPHLFASPRMAALLAQNIADALSKIDPAGAELYLENARAYAEKMNRLADAAASLGRQLANNRIVTQHGVLDYLARDMGLRIVAVLQAHAGQEPSASEMLRIVDTIRREKAGAVFTEPQYPEKIGRTLAGEAGIAAATLDPVASGSESAPLDYYETQMRRNLMTLGKTLGTK